MKFKITAAAVVLVTLSSGITTYAGGGKGTSSGVGGGGTAVILPDDTVVLADPYVSQNGLPPDGQLGTLVKLGAPLVEELTRAGEMISRYAGLTPDYFDSKNPFLFENVLGATTQYRMVTQIPEICPYRAPNLNGVPANSQVAEIACTKGQYTFIKEDLFRRMTVREQAKLIIHERLRATSLSSDLLADRVIADITTGVDTALSLYNSLLQGQRPIPTEQEYSHFQAMVKTLALHWDAFDSHPGFDVQVLKNGGGLVIKPSGEPPPGYVGVGSAVGANTQMAADSEIVGFGSTCVFGNCVLEKGAKIAFSSIGTSYFQRRGTIHLGENAVLAHSTLNEVVALDLGNGAQIEHVQFRLSGKLNDIGTIQLAAGSQLKNLTDAAFRFRRVDFYVAESGLITGALASMPVALAVGSSTALVAGFFGGLIGGGWTAGFINAGTGIRFNHLTIDGVLDAEGQTLCKSGANDFRDNWGNKAQVHSLAQLAQRCKKHKLAH